jgi:glycosyltransferase involved in cell wall biosynthesis
MRVLHVIPSIAALDGGTSKVVLDTCKALRASGVAVEIATTNTDEDSDFVIPKEGPALIGDVPVYFFARRNRWRYKFSWGITTWLSQNVGKYDLLHIHAVFSYSTAVAARYARKYDVPYIMVPHGMLAPWPIRKNRLIKQVYLKGIEKKNMERAAAVHFGAEDEFRTSLLIGRSNFVSPYVVDFIPAANGSSRSKTGSKLRILYLSRLDPKKGIDLLFGAVCRLASERKDFELVVAGSGEPEYEQQVKAMIEKMGLSAVTRLVGFVEGAEKASLFKSADLFVLSSYDENFGIAVAEAMAAGLPVLVTDRVNIHEQIREGGAGLVVSATVDSVYAGIRKMLDDSELRLSMGRRGSQLVINKFSPAAMTRNTLEIYRDIIHNSRESKCWVSAS